MVKPVEVTRDYGKGKCHEGNPIMFRYFLVIDHPLTKAHFKFNLQFIPQLKIFVELSKATNLLSDTFHVCHFQPIFQLFHSR